MILLYTRSRKEQPHKEIRQHLEMNLDLILSRIGPKIILFLMSGKEKSHKKSGDFRKPLHFVFISNEDPLEGI